MRVTHTRANAITLVATSQELSALVAGARMAVALMSADPDAPAEARRLSDLLRRVLADYDAGLSRVGAQVDDRPPPTPSSAASSSTRAR